MTGMKRCHARVFSCTLMGVAAAAGAATGCGHARLVPGEEAHIVTGTDSAAFAETAGVRCSAEAGTWTGRADDLPSSVTPVKVRIRNRSGQPLRVLYQEFTLVGGSGRKYHPLPPLPLAEEGGAPPRPIRPAYSSSNFFVAPRFRDVYATLLPWSEPLPRDDAAYGRRYSEWGDTPPAPIAIRDGLPEGVLADDGIVSGYLYFETPLQHESRVSLQARLDRADQAGGQGEGGDGAAADEDGGVSIKIPFRVE
jgi:hypothetical protein